MGKFIDFNGRIARMAYLKEAMVAYTISALCAVGCVVAFGGFVGLANEGRKGAAFATVILGATCVLVLALYFIKSVSLCIQRLRDIFFGHEMGLVYGLYFLSCLIFAPVAFALFFIPSNQFAKAPKDESTEELRHLRAEVEKNKLKEELERFNNKKNAA